MGLVGVEKPDFISYVQLGDKGGVVSSSGNCELECQIMLNGQIAFVWWGQSHLDSGYFRFDSDY